MRERCRARSGRVTAEGRCSGPDWKEALPKFSHPAKGPGKPQKLTGRQATRRRAPLKSGALLDQRLDHLISNKPPKSLLDVARQLGSRAMRADAIESITCGWLSLVVVLGLIANRLLAAWWIDAVTSLGIVWFILKEAREAWSGEDCCGDE